MTKDQIRERCIELLSSLQPENKVIATTILEQHGHLFSEIEILKLLHFGAFKRFRKSNSDQDLKEFAALSLQLSK